MTSACLAYNGRMRRLVSWIEAAALAAGGPGLFVVALLDSSVLSLPEINDLLLVLMCMRHKDRMLYYALMATLGSVVGCFLLFWVGRRGGEAFLRRRFHESHVQRGLKLFERYGVITVIVPAVLPPPAPFKIFVLLAGMLGLPTRTFLLAIFGSRAARYVVEGVLAVRYGEAALLYLKANYVPVTMAVVVLTIAAVVIYRFSQHR